MLLFFGRVVPTVNEIFWVVDNLPKAFQCI